MKHYWFEIIDENSNLCGEEFLVGADSKAEALEIVRDNFTDEDGYLPKYKFLGTVSEDEAETLGIDEY